ncbi:unnamed protein product [Linum tenue]|uniref:SCP domain-containing protein n=1 Tax=Linum tenue TaxID=586396 RepID=A0AAV0LYE3_9ROSI|nr:unnamed protein product [Linum tenue]
MLAAHGTMRARNCLLRLAWTTKVADNAKWYANQRRKGCHLIYSTGDYGENIIWGRGKRWKGTDAVTDWADHEVYYDYERYTCMPNQDCLHYMQLVCSTRRVRCARVKCANRNTYVVCEYDPHGYVIGQRRY